MRWLRLRLSFMWHLTFILLFLGSCANTEPQLVSSGTLDRAYISSGIEKFFHVDLPHWANFSSAGQCQRKTNIRYLHFENLKNSYDLGYQDLIHLQNMFNRKLYAYKTSATQDEIPLKDESYVFYNVYQQVLGGSFDFIEPKFKKVSVVWIDPYLGDKKKLIQIIRSERVLQGHPILLSHCLTSYELEEFARSLNLDELGVKYLSADMFSIYGEDIIPKYRFTINLQKFLPGKEISVFGKTSFDALLGDYKFIPLE